MNAVLPTMPLADIRTGGPVQHAIEDCDRARALRDECLAFFPRALAPCLPLLDRLARRWLRRSRSPYVAEIEAIAAALGFSGAWFLNGSYQWGCTTLAREEQGVPWLARTLDWPFPGLGRHAEVLHLADQAGEFFSVAWPGYVGVLTGMAPGRFAVALNQAPMRRRTRKTWLRPFDFAANAARTWSIRYIPPDHLLRETFATCDTFEEAKRKLERTPVARPVIFTLIGCGSGEKCVIERTEEDFATRTHDTCAANDWHEPQAGWEGRIAAEALWTCSFSEAAENSRARRAALVEWIGDLAHGGFSWVTPPVLNPYTRLAIAMCPAKAMLHAIGYEAPVRGELPRAVTGIGSVTRTAHLA